MRKRILGLLLFLVMALSLMPMTAFAATTEYGVWVGGVRVTSDNQKDVLQDGGSVMYQYGTLWLNKDVTISGAHIENGEAAAIYAETNLKISFNGASVHKVTLDMSGINANIYTGIDVGMGFGIENGTTADIELNINIPNAESYDYAYGIFAQSILSSNAANLTVNMNMPYNCNNTYGLYTNDELRLLKGSYHFNGVRTPIYAANGVYAKDGLQYDSYCTTSEGVKEYIELNIFNKKKIAAQYSSCTVQPIFPDPVLYEIMFGMYDTDGNGRLSEKELNRITTVQHNYGRKIKNMDGLHKLPNLETVDCGNNPDLKTLDLKNVPNLKYLSCNNCSLTELDISRNPKLENLRCQNNQLTALDVSKNPELKILFCDVDEDATAKISELDLTNNTKLTSLSCINQPVGSLDLSNCAALAGLNCVGCQLTELDLSHNAELRSLYCTDNRLSSIDLSKTQIGSDTSDKAYTAYVDKQQGNGTITVYTTTDRVNTLKNYFNGKNVRVEDVKQIHMGETSPTISSLSSSATGVQVSWGAVDGITQYRVFYKTATGAWTTFANVKGTSTTVTGLKSGTAYSFLVRCLSADGKTYTDTYDAAKSKSLTYIAQPAVSSLSNTSTGVEVKWNAVGGAAQYRVFYKAAGGAWTGFGNTKGTGLVVTGLTAGKTYSFTVRCVSADGKTYTSTYDTTGKSIVYQPTATTLAKPEISSLSNVTNGVQVKWNAVPGAAQYRVFYKTATGAWTGFNNTTGTSLTVTGLTAGTTYSFMVRCLSADGKTYTSNYDTVGKSIVYQPAASTMLAKPEITALNSNSAGVQVSWGAVSGAAQYRVFYKTATGAWTTFGNTTGTSLTVTGLTSGTTYSFLVRCLSADGKAYTSDYDAAMSKSHTYIAQPAVSSVTNTSTGVQVKWNAVGGAAQYRVFYKPAGGAWTGYKNTTANSMVVTGLTKGTTYSFTVRCVSADGKSYTSTYDTTGKSIKVE